MTSIEVNDYIKFTRMIQPAKKQRIRSSTGKNFDHELEPATIVEISGQGLVRTVAKNAKKFGDEKVRTARVDTGSMGVVTAVIDDAVIIGTQTGMDLSWTEVLGKESSMYDAFGDFA